MPVPSRSPGEIVEALIEDLERNPTGAEAQNVVKNLPKLVRVETSVTIQAPTAHAEARAGGNVSPLPQEFGFMEHKSVTKSP